MQQKLHAALGEIPQGFRQAQRLVEFLAEHPLASTAEVAQRCAIGNISDVASKVNPYLHHHGLFISCRRPQVPIPNRFGEPSLMYEWCLHELEEQAA